MYILTMLLELLAVYGGLALVRDATVKAFIGAARLGVYMGHRKRMKRDRERIDRIKNNLYRIVYIHDASQDKETKDKTKEKNSEASYLGPTC